MDLYPAVTFSISSSIEGGTSFIKAFANHIDHFLGIQYATAGRFEEPQEVPLWEGKRDAKNLRNFVPQSMESLSKEFSPPKRYIKEQNMDEDCLYLNIWRPSKVNKGHRLPVLVFIHGGNFKSGCGDIFDGEILACGTGAIVVNFNYRLGILGFMCTKDGVLQGNYGLLDQVAALKWINKYIEYFGGDKNNVTLYGVGSGATMATAHMMSSLSKGLFHKVICSSGNLISPIAYSREFFSETLYFFAKRFGYSGSKDGKEIKEYLMQLPISSITRITHNAIPMGVCIDGKFLTKHPKELIESKEYSQVPLMLGTFDEGFKMFSKYLTSTDGKLKGADHFNMILNGIVKDFTFMNSSTEVTDEVVQKLVKSFGPKRTKKDEDYLKSGCKIFGDMMVNFPTYKLAYMHQSNAPVYMYEVHVPNMSVEAPSWVETCHGEEYRFTFGETFAERSEIPWKKEHKDISISLIKRFTEFLTKGEISDWKPFTPETKYIEIFKAPEAKIQSNYDDKRMKVWVELDQKAEKDANRKSMDQLNLNTTIENLFKVYFAKGFNI
ncbi:DgyrCDS10181 [Dimorphilus gyrociliatus]|uniref:DgyrCDS10181 n=1 Tax=Dimorphilus gyrociliatus TaxID=2664684 RepID=A0A7I8W1G0_9ANNE|nr:DgyrCDS10181 [Dimorphilus gyrociliatus]